MFPKLSLLVAAVTLLTACATPQTLPLPLGEGQGVRETSAPTSTPPPTETPAIAATETPTDTPEPTATPEAFNLEAVIPVKEIKSLEEAKQVPFVPEEIITDPTIMDQQIEKWVEAELCRGNFPPNARPFDGVFEAFDANSGTPVRMFRIPGDAVGAGTYKNEVNRPTFNMCFVQTLLNEKLNGKPYFIAIAKWKNIDGSEARINYGIAFEDLTQNLLDLFGFSTPNKDWLTVPAAVPQTRGVYKWDEIYDSYFNDYYQHHFEKINIITQELLQDPQTRVTDKFSSVIVAPATTTTHR